MYKKLNKKVLILVCLSFPSISFASAGAGAQATYNQARFNVAVTAYKNTLIQKTSDEEKAIGLRALAEAKKAFDKKDYDAFTGACLWLYETVAYDHGISFQQDNDDFDGSSFFHKINAISAAYTAPYVNRPFVVPANTTLEELQRMIAAYESSVVVNTSQNLAVRNLHNNSADNQSDSDDSVHTVVAIDAEAWDIVNSQDAMQQASNDNSDNGYNQTALKNAGIGLVVGVLAGLDEHISGNNHAAAIKEKNSHVFAGKPGGSAGSTNGTTATLKFSSVSVIDCSMDANMGLFAEGCDVLAALDNVLQPHAAVALEMKTEIQQILACMQENNAVEGQIYRLKQLLSLPKLKSIIQ